MCFLILFSELNDTIVEAQLRTKQIPPSLQTNDAVESYSQSNNRLLILVTISFSCLNLKRTNQLLILVPVSFLFCRLEQIIFTKHVSSNFFGSAQTSYVRNEAI